MLGRVLKWAALRSMSLERPLLSEAPNVMKRQINNKSSPNQRSPSLSCRASLSTKADAVKEPPAMFCFQCEQTKNHTGCTEVGVCGKQPHVAKLQDFTVYMTKVLSFYLCRLRELGEPIDLEASRMIMECLFALGIYTVTNVNFDASRFVTMIHELSGQVERLTQLYHSKDTHPKVAPFPVYNRFGADIKTLSMEKLKDLGSEIGLVSQLPIYGESIRGVRELTMYGLKGTATYYAHATRLGATDPMVDQEIIEILDWLHSAPDAEAHDLEAALGKSLKVGEINMRVMELLDNGHREQFGVPTPSECNLMPVPGPCILVSGHDLHDLRKILEATKDIGVNVYTHGEMLPAHGYPGLNKYKHLVGNYGGAWQMQQYEFPGFPGPVIMTTNCLIQPRAAYSDRLYTLNAVGWDNIPNVDIHESKNTHILKIIGQAKMMGGFTEKDIAKYKHKPPVTVGFGREAVLGAAGTVLNAVSDGSLRHIFLVGGCDGSENKRSWFTELVDNLPKETLVLTLGCAKYRFNTRRDFGTLGDTGIPRLLDMGQCNDAYGAVKVAQALAQALDTDINSLPLSLCISWFEQKAVAVLLTLLHLASGKPFQVIILNPGVRNIRLGPVLPGFITEEVYDILHEKFNLMAIDLNRKRDPVEDIQLMMTKQAAELGASGHGKRRLVKDRLKDFQNDLLR